MEQNVTKTEFLPQPECTSRIQIERVAVEVSDYNQKDAQTRTTVYGGDRIPFFGLLPGVLGFSPRQPFVFFLFLLLNLFGWRVGPTRHLLREEMKLNDRESGSRFPRTITPACAFFKSSE